MEKTLRIFITVALFGLFAQLVDGSLGMGYGVTSTSLLLSIGFGTAAASAIVHFSEIFTTFVSGISHFKFGNIDGKILKYLAGAGVPGGILGAYLSARVQNLSAIKPFVAAILLVLGALIVIKTFKIKKSGEQEYKTPRIRRLAPLGFIAAFVDAIGGGGWGPITAPSLILTDAHPQKTIGSVNAAEFFVTLAISITFLLALPSIDLLLAVPLIVGGVVGAPIAAYTTKKVNHKWLGAIVGVFIMVLSIRTILISLGLRFIF